MKFQGMWMNPGEGPGEGAFPRQHAGTASLSNELKNSSDAPGVTANSSNTVHLRDWIQQTLKNIGDRNGSRAALSSMYLVACIKVAKHLAGQLVQAEKLASYGISKKLDVLPIDDETDWVNYTTVRLKDRLNDNVENTINEPSQDQTLQSQQEQDGKDMWKPEQVSNMELNKKLEAFLETFGINEPSKTEPRSEDSQTESDPSSLFDWTSGALVGLHDSDSNGKNEQNQRVQQSCHSQSGAELVRDVFDGTVYQNVQVNHQAASEAQCSPHASLTASACKNVISEDGNESDEDINEQFEELMKKFGMDGVKGSEKTVKEGSDQKVPASTSVNQHIMPPQHNDTPKSTQDEWKDYLNVESADIKCPENSQIHFNSDANANQDKLRRIYYLALVFYELFSGGERPSQELRSLASFRMAFISLPTLTVVTENGSDCDDHMGLSNEPKRRQGPSGSINKDGLCKLSFECLKFMGVPGPICLLIFNMLDCVYGDLSGNESYNCASDVASDLQLMLDKPKHLQGLDMDELSSGLQLEKLSISLEQEMRLILTSYQNCLSGSREVVTIEGESGTGKSLLAQAAASTIVSGGGFYFIGKFDQMQQSRPFSALAAALDQYCDLLLSQIGSDWAGMVVGQLKAALGRDALFLIEILPKLDLILVSKESCPSPYFGNDVSFAVQRIQYLLCQFIEVISLTSPVSVTLCLDDVQWADEASILVMKRLFLNARKKFFFMACYREDEMNSNHSFGEMTETARENGISVISVKLKNMQEDALTSTLSDLLCLSPRLVQPLSRIVHNKTKGNPQFVAQLMGSLHHDGLLRVDMKSQRWAWDEDKILSSKLPNNVALCFINRIKKLPMEVQLALHTLSVFGASAKHDYIKALESQFSVSLSNPLKVAIAEGLVTDIKGTYHFCHDRIQETSYKMIQEQDRLCNHLTYGQFLAQQALQTNDNAMFFTAINQVNYGGPSAVTDGNDYFAMANHNLTAGKKAMAMSDFHAAYSFFDNGITFLRKHHWKDLYPFSLEIYNLALKCALVTGNSQTVQILADHIDRHAHSFEDKLNMHYIVMCWKENTSNVLQSLEKGLQIVSKLGENVPNNPNQSTLSQLMQQTLAIITGISETDLLNYRTMTDSRKLAAMRFLAKLQNTAFFINDTLHSCIILKMIRMTIAHGLSPMSPVGFATFGSLLAKANRLQLGGRFTKLAETLNEKMGSKDAAGEVLFMVSEVRCFIQPTLAANEIHLQGEAAAVSAGDSTVACFNRLLYCINLYWSGIHLEVVKEKVEKACLFMKDQGHAHCLTYMMIVQSSVLMLIQSETEIPRRNDLLKSLERNGERRVLLTIFVHDMYLAFILHHGDLKHSFLKYFEHEANSGIALYNEAIHTFIVALAAFRLYRDTLDMSFAEKGRQRIQMIKKWAEQGSKWNFEHLVLICEAEERYSLGDFEGAQESYKKSISMARIHKFQNDEALANELAGRFFMETGNYQTSLEHLRMAHERYRKWGAVSKAGKLFSYINDKFASLVDATECSNGSTLKMSQ